MTANELRKEIIRALFEETWSQERFDAVAPHLGETVRFHYRTTFPTNLHELKQLVAHWRTAFPDLQFEIIDIIAEGDLVAANLVFTGTHRGQWQSIAPTGAAIRVEEMMFFRFEGEHIVEAWEVVDEVAMLRQLGVEIV